MKEKSVRKECLEVLESILPNFELEILDSVIDERNTNGFYSEEKNVTYPKSEPFFIAEIGTKNDDKHSFFTAKFYVYGLVSVVSGYSAKVCNGVMQKYHDEIKAKQEQSQKRKFKLIEDIYV